MKFRVQITGVIEAPTKADAEVLISQALENLTWHGGALRADGPFAHLHVVETKPQGESDAKV